MAQQITMSPSDFLIQPDGQQQPSQQIPSAAPKVKTGMTMSVSDWNKLPATQAQGGAQAQWSPNPDDYIAEIQTSDGNRHLIHGDDLAEAQRRDSNIKVVSQPQTYRDYARGRTLMNMSRAMSGQPMARPGDQAEAERGRRTGTIAGAVTLATGAVGGLLTPGVQVAEEASQILGPEGQPIIKQVVKDAPSAIGQIITALPKQATLHQALKIAEIAYKLGIGGAGASLIWHEFFGTK